MRSFASESAASLYSKSFNSEWSRWNCFLSHLYTWVMLVIPMKYSVMVKSVPFIGRSQLMGVPFTSGWKSSSGLFSGFMVCV